MPLTEEVLTLAAEGIGGNALRFIQLRRAPPIIYKDKTTKNFQAAGLLVDLLEICSPSFAIDFLEGVSW